MYTHKLSFFFDLERIPLINVEIDSDLNEEVELSINLHNTRISKINFENQYLTLSLEREYLDRTLSFILVIKDEKLGKMIKKVRDWSNSLNSFVDFLRFFQMKRNKISYDISKNLKRSGA